MALVAISRGTVSAPPRIAARAPTGLLGCMPAHVPGLGLAAKLVSVFDAPGAGAGHSTHFGLVAVFDEHDGRPLAIMEAGRLTALRTAATATVSLQALAPEARRIAVVGAGVQARAQLELLAAVAPSADVVVGARDPEAARALVAAFPGVRSASIRRRRPRRRRRLLLHRRLHSGDPTRLARPPRARQLRRRVEGPRGRRRHRGGRDGVRRVAGRRRPAAAGRARTSCKDSDPIG